MTIDIKATLRDRGLRQKDLAAALGVSEPTVSLWAKALRDGDVSRLPLERVKAFCALTGIDAHTLRPDVFDPPAPAPAEPVS